MTYIPDHLRQISLGEEIESISHKGRDRNRHSVDLTVSPEKYRNVKADRVKTHEDTNDNDTDEATKVYGKDRNDQRDTEKTDEDTNDDTYETVKFNKG